MRIPFLEKIVSVVVTFVAVSGEHSMIVVTIDSLWHNGPMIVKFCHENHIPAW